MIVPGPSLVVSAPVAVALEQAVAEAEARARRDGIAVHPEVAETLAELHDLVAWWRASVARKPAGPDAEAPGSSGPMTTDQAAAVLGVSASRVRQMLRAGTLAGDRTNSRWHVDRAALEARDA